MDGQGGSIMRGFFGNSELYYKGETKELFPQKTKKLVCPDKEIAMPIVLLEDAAYTLKIWLFKPYTNRANLISAQRMFNYRLSRARITIESTFGHLNGRWRCLQKRQDVSVDFFQYSCNSMCYIMHNLCKKRRERYMDKEREEEHEERDDRYGAGEEAQPSAIILRNDLATYFAITE